MRRFGSASIWIAGAVLLPAGLVVSPVASAAPAGSFTQAAQAPAGTAQPAAGSAQPAAEPPQVTTGQAEGVANLREVKSTVACAGATTPESMRAVKALGYAAVVNLRRDSEKDANIEAEKAAAEAAGLTYIHIPMDGANPDPAVVDRFLDAARDPANSPLFVHCATGNRAASVWLVKRVIVDGWPVERALNEAQGLGLTSDRLKAFALDYVKTHHGK